MTTTIEEAIIGFAIRNKGVLVLTRGNDPESGSKVYWLLAEGQYNFALGRRSSKLELRLGRERGEYVDIMMCPIGNSDYAWIGEEIWRRGRIHSLSDAI